MKKIILCMMVFGALALEAVEGNRGILCLTFDDRSKGWINYAIPIFEKYKAHATFFWMGELSTNDLADIRKLADAGHTVGLHTVGHRNAPEGFAEEGPSSYLNSQIRRPKVSLESIGIPAKYLAYPNNRHTPETDARLALEGFVRFRAGGKDGSQFFPVSELSRHRVMQGKGIGEYYHTDIDEVCAEIRRAAERNEVLTYFSHAIGPQVNRLSMPTEWLERILATAGENGVRVLGFDELGPVEYDSPAKPLKLTLTFDDALKSHLEIAAPELEKRGWRGVFSIVIEWIGKGAYHLTWDDVRELAKRGHEIAVHGYTHKGMGYLARRDLFDELRHEIADAANVIERETGLRPKLLCLPGTDGAPEVTKIAKQYGLTTMLVSRHCFGAWGNDVRQSIRTIRKVGMERADFLVHGITPETMGWKPFPSKEKFIGYLDGIAEAERSGEVSVVPYAELLK